MLNLKSAEYVSYFGETMNVYEILVGNSEKKGSTLGAKLWMGRCY